MKSLIVFLSALCGVCSAYHLAWEASGHHFFDKFNFFHWGDPTHGYVNYVDARTAFAKGYAKVRGDGKVYIGADHHNVAHGRGRDSVKLQSKQRFTGGLFVLDLEHMPHGCGTWPAFWTVGSHWPYKGEIDIIEYVEEHSHNQATLHTSQNCQMYQTPKSMFTGYNTHSKDCNVVGKGNSGCGIKSDNPHSYGAALNRVQGGVYAMEWTPYHHIKVWFFERSRIPGDLHGNSPNPNGWGKPFAYFPLHGNCNSNHFSDHTIVFDLTFCGDWDGNAFSCAGHGRGACNHYVKYHPQAFADAYWLVNYVKVFK